MYFIWRIIGSYTSTVLTPIDLFKSKLKTYTKYNSYKRTSFFKKIYYNLFFYNIKRIFRRLKRKLNLNSKSISRCFIYKALLTAIPRLPNKNNITVLSNIYNRRKSKRLYLHGLTPYWWFTGLKIYYFDGTFFNWTYYLKRTRVAPSYYTSIANYIMYSSLMVGHYRKMREPIKFNTKIMLTIPAYKVRDRAIHINFRSYYNTGLLPESALTGKSLSRWVSF